MYRDFYQNSKETAKIKHTEKKDLLQNFKNFDTNLCMFVCMSQRNAQAHAHWIS